MGQLQEQTIPSLFQGISRQPATIRFPGQVEDAENVIFEVETGGFSKRPGTEFIGSLGSVAGDIVDPEFKPISFRIIKVGGKNYSVRHLEGQLSIHDIETMQEMALEFEHEEDADIINRDPSDLVFMNVLDTTFVLDKTQVVEMTDPFEVQENWVYGAAQLTNSGVEDTYSFTIKTESGEKYTKSVNVNDVERGTRDIIGMLRNTSWSDDGAPPSEFTVWFEGSFIYVRREGGESFSIETDDPFGSSAWRTAVSRTDSVERLPAKAWNGHRVEIRAPQEEEGYWLKFSTDSGEGRGGGFWDETIPDGTENEFDAATMPKTLVRVDESTFRIERPEWDTKKAGGNKLVPKPEFVGKPITDILFFSNRLGFLSGETVFFSGSGDYFRFWPNSGITFEDDDPFGLTNTGSSDSKFAFGVNFRRSLYITADHAQFEVFGQPFTPNTAAIEIATSYPTGNAIRPETVGDELYFVSSFGNKTALYAYTYMEDTASETAMEVSKHVDSLIDGQVHQMVSNPLTNEIFLLTKEDPSLIYVHRWYYDGQERAQSSWTKFRLPGRSIRGLDYKDGAIIFLTERILTSGTEVVDRIQDLERYPSTLKAEKALPMTPRLDRQWIGMTGQYDHVTNRTVLNHPTDNRTRDVSEMTAVLLDEPAENEDDREIELYLDEQRNWYIIGHVNPTQLLFGVKYNAYGELSTQYLRDNRDVPIISGRLQLRQMNVWYAQTGYFKTRVKTKGREDRIYEFNNRTIGSSENKIQSHTISDGTFRFLVRSRTDNTRIIFESDSFLPFTITSIAWTGFFNEISRQG